MSWHIHNNIEWLYSINVFSRHAGIYYCCCPFCLFPLRWRVREILIWSLGYFTRSLLFFKGLLNCITRLWRSIAESTAGTCIGAAGSRSLLLWVFYNVISRLKCCRQQRKKNGEKKCRVKTFIFEHLKLASWEYFSRHCLGKVTRLGLGEMSWLWKFAMQECKPWLGQLDHFIFPLHDV